MHKTNALDSLAAWALTVPAPSLAQITPTTSEPVPPVAARGADATSAIDESSWRAAFGQANFLGSHLYANDAVIGEIEELIGRERSAVPAAVIPVGGFLGLGGTDHDPNQRDHLPGVITIAFANRSRARKPE